MTAVRVATLAGDPEREADVAASLGAHPDAEIVMRCVDRVEILALLRGAQLDAIVSVGAPSWFDRQCAAEAAQAHIPVVALAEPQDREVLEGLGATVVSLDVDADEIIARCAAPATAPTTRLSGQPSRARGKLFAVWGPKGAPGRTTVAVELASELAASEPETLLLDGDPYGGDVLQVLGITEELPTAIWAARMAARDELDAARLVLDLRRAGRDGPVLLPGLPRAELWAEITDFGWRQLLTVARASFLFTVVDVGFCLESDSSPYPRPTGGRNAIARTTAASADRIVAVCRADPVGIKQFLWQFDELKRLVPVEKALIVANRVRASEERDVGDIIRRHTGKKPITYIPDKPADFAKAVRTGSPLRVARPSSEVCGRIRLLAASLGASIPPRGVLTRLGGRAS